MMKLIIPESVQRLMKYANLNPQTIEMALPREGGWAVHDPLDREQLADELLYYSPDALRDEFDIREWMKDGDLEALEEMADRREDLLEEKEAEAEEEYQRGVWEDDQAHAAMERNLA